MASTIPQPSCPGFPGGCGYSNHSRPSHTGILEAHKPQPSSLIRISPDFGSGNLIFFTRIFPGDFITAAWKRFFLLGIFFSILYGFNSNLTLQCFFQFVVYKPVAILPGVPKASPSAGEPLFQQNNLLSSRLLFQTSKCRTRNRIDRLHASLQKKYQWNSR